MCPCRDFSPDSMWHWHNVQSFAHFFSSCHSREKHCHVGFLPLPGRPNGLSSIAFPIFPTKKKKKKSCVGCETVKGRGSAFYVILQTSHAQRADIPVRSRLLWSCLFAPLQRVFDQLIAAPPPRFSSLVYFTEDVGDANKLISSYLSALCKWLHSSLLKRLLKSLIMADWIKCLFWSPSLEAAASNPLFGMQLFRFFFLH